MQCWMSHQTYGLLRDMVWSGGVSRWFGSIVSVIESIIVIPGRMVRTQLKGLF